jgi:cellulose synthase/poly-beta-1,6-N-acetylglucosamine synthase-like glycosyltransferase
MAKPRATAPSAPGTVAFMTAGLGRYAAAAQCMVALEKPAGATVEWFSGGVNIASNRNVVAAHFAGDWLCMIDDDQVFTPDLLHRLLRHLANDRVDIVVPLILRRNPPHAPCLLVSGPPKGARTQVVDVQQGRQPVRYFLRQMKLTNQRGLQAVEAAGSGIMLIRRRVFERVPRPWFESRGDLGEDFHFCLKARAAGCGVFCDVDTTAGHVTPVAVWPTRQPSGRWGSSFSYLHLGQLGIVKWFVKMDSKAKRKILR